MEIGALMEVAARLERAESPIHDGNTIRGLVTLEESVAKAEAAWSGSWLGYHSRVYYKGLNPPPGSAKFSHEWGLLEDGTHGRISTGEWRKCRVEDVVSIIWKNAGHPNVSAIRQEAVVAAQIFEAAKHEILSHLKPILAERANDETLARVVGKIREASLMASQDFIQKWMPAELPFSRDEFAIGEGVQVPPHMSVKAEVWAIRQPFMACGELAKSVRRLLTHLANPGDADKKRPPAVIPRVITVQPQPPGQARKSGSSQLVADEPALAVLTPDVPLPPARDVPAEPTPAVKLEAPSSPSNSPAVASASPVARPLGMRAPSLSAEKPPETPASSVQRMASPMSAPRPTALKPPDSAAPVNGGGADQSGVCLCHGRSGDWKALREMLRKELPRDYHELTLVPMAGIPNRDKMDELCRQCGLAVLILTEEDIRLEGARNAETSAIHTAGIFQGRLGYGRVVLLIEEGCEGLSHLQDLPQFAYPRGGIKGVAGEIKSILEREGL